MAFPPVSMRSPLQWFRRAQNLLERAVHSDSDSVVLRQSHSWARAITWSLIGCTAFGVGWLALARTEEIVVAPGKLEPIGSVKEVRLPLGGVVEDMLVKEGDRVKAGQVLLRLESDTSADRRFSLVKALAYKQDQIAHKRNELERYRDLNSTEQRSLVQSLALERDIANRLASLQREGAVPDLQFLQQRNKAQQVESQLKQSMADRRRQEAILFQGLEQLQSELADLRSRLSEAETSLRYQVIKSPVNGLVFDLKPTGKGFVAQTSEPVLRIVPYDKLEARVEVASSDIGFVRLNKPADISIDSFPATDFGVLTGLVRKIGSDALPPDQMHQTYRFPVDIRLNEQQLKLKSGQRLPLQVGMSLTANIKLRKVTYLQLLLSDFKNKADSLRQI